MFDFRPGFHMHVIQARRLAVTPWGWRPGLVSQVDGLHLTVTYLDGGTAALWHHEEVEELVLGLPVRVHEQYRALEVGDTWFHVLVRRGVGAVPEPEDLEPWNDLSGTTVYMELTTGRARRADPAG